MWLLALFVDKKTLFLATFFIGRFGEIHLFNIHLSIFVDKTPNFIIFGVFHVDFYEKMQFNKLYKLSDKIAKYKQVNMYLVNFRDNITHLIFQTRIYVFYFQKFENNINKEVVL